MNTVSVSKIVSNRASLVCLLLCISNFLLSDFVAAATPAGAVIRNQASATFVDSTGQSVLVTSNVVETLVKQVAGIELTQSQSAATIPGQSIRFSHRLINTGNGDDQYRLQVTEGLDNLFAIESLSIYPDVNRDGIADSVSSISSTPVLAANESFTFLVEAVVSAEALAGYVGTVQLNANSRFQPSLGATNTDTITFTSDAVVRLTKSISQTQGAAPSGPYTVTINYTNAGAATAASVELLDALPSGMNYVPNSGVWSETNSPLSDDNPIEEHASSTNSGSIRWCSYHPSCTNFTVAAANSSNTSVNQVSAVLSALPPGVTGFIRFDIEIDENQMAGLLVNEAEAPQR